MLPVSHRKGRYWGPAAASDKASLHIRVAARFLGGRVCGGRLRGAEGSPVIGGHQNISSSTITRAEPGVEL